MDAIGEDADALVERAASGDREAEERLIGLARPLVARYLRSRIDTAEDRECLEQTILIRVARGLDRFQRQCPFSAWALHIAANCLKTYYAARGRSPQQNSLDALEAEGKVPESAIEAGPFDQVQSNSIVEGWLTWVREACTPDQARVILLAYQCESIEEVAATMRIGSATAWSHFRRGRAHLLAYVAEHYPDALGGKGALHAAANACSQAGGRNALTSEERLAIDEPNRRRKALQSACLKLAPFLPLPSLVLLLKGLT